MLGRNLLSPVWCLTVGKSKDPTGTLCLSEWSHFKPVWARVWALGLTLCFNLSVIQQHIQAQQILSYDIPSKILDPEDKGLS